jgi:hypothetical protein
MASVVVTPENYEELSRAQRKRIIPIGIRACDQHRYPIASGWFSRGVALIRRPLAGMTQYQLAPRWRTFVSAKIAVPRLWAGHGSYLRRFPTRKLLQKAISLSEELTHGECPRNDHVFRFDRRNRWRVRPRLTLSTAWRTTIRRILPTTISTSRTICPRCLGPVVWRPQRMMHPTSRHRPAWVGR